MTSRPALAAGTVTLGLVAAACALAWREDSPLVPRDGGLADQGTAPLFLVLLVGAFATYAVGLALLRRGLPRVRWVLVLAFLVQLVPLGVPLLLSTDAWTYWGYGWIAAEGGGNPYVDPPSAFPESPAFPYLGAAWRDTTTVYGPAFTLLSEPVARVAGSSADAAAWIYKAIAAAGILAAVAAVARVAARPALAVAFVGWNPVVAVHMAGGGHNDALVAGLAAGALALAVGRRHQLAGAAWVLAALVKWVPVVFLVLVTLAARARGRPVGWPRHDRGARRRGKHRDLAVRDGMARGLRPARRQRRPRDELRASVPPRAARAPGRRRPRAGPDRGRGGVSSGSPGGR